MNNQILGWFLLLISWITLLFLKKKDFKRFITVAFLSILYTNIFVHIGESFNWWIVKERLYPLQILPNTYGLNAVATIWIFKLAYGRFPLYMLIEVIGNSIFAYLYLGYFLRIRNILEFNLVSPLFVVIIHTIAGVCLYYFQIWIEGIYAEPYREINKKKV